MIHKKQGGGLNVLGIEGHAQSGHLVDLAGGRWMNIYIYIYIYTYIYTHTYTYTHIERERYTHTYIDIYICIYI